MLMYIMCVYKLCVYMYTVCIVHVGLYTCVYTYNADVYLYICM